MRFYKIRRTHKMLLEQYVSSKNLTNAAEVDHWQHEYETVNTQDWGHGL